MHMAKWMENQTKADADHLERLRVAKDAAKAAYNAEYRKQKTKYEQRARRAAQKGEADAKD